MPGGTALVAMLFIVTVDPFLAGMNTSCDQVGMFMCPAVGGFVEGGSAGIRSQAGFAAAWSPWRVSVTVLLNASLRETEKLGPVKPLTVDGITIAAGGEIEKSGICMTVPL